jgi:surface antigen
MKRLRKLLLVALPCAALMAGPALADPPWSHGRGRGHEDNEHHWKGDREHYREREQHHGFHGGPPPWAPAYGYRRGGDDDEHEHVVMPVNVETGSCNRELVGQILGGATGGLVGSQIGTGSGRLAAIAAGTVVGMLVGGEIGREMDRADKLCVDQALETAPDGTRIHWNDNNRDYTVTPTSTRKNADGQYCREYQTVSNVGGKTQQVYGKACRQPDGSWKIVS